MKLLLPWVLVAGAVLSAAQAPADREDWIQLFDGKSLAGWTPKITGYPVGENALHTFRVEDGLLKVRYDEYDTFKERFGHLFYKDAFSYYVVAVEYRFVGDQVSGGPGWATRNSGIMVHGQPAQTMQREQDFPISIEVQLLGGLGKGPRTTANLCTPGTNVEMNGVLFTRHCQNSSSATFDGDQWVRAEAHVHGGEFIRHVVNGQVVLEYQRPQVGGGNVTNHDPRQKVDGTLLTSGSISLQSESHPVDFRKVELLNLSGCRDPKARNYKRYIVHDEPGSCRY
ncbi:hypothetical protein TBR22_A14430 [Luteitalea sp. TBR-22]|uniref:3-keto-disaccharide hydrolase n=1 Tax=Luteitalea sp. TBR-22 TaxID=2802971 RepID=UPI001AFB7EC5|nr:DUF1080 domain-containing protein [Luteitalea sp. TBR-22]BCS32233.1 hypothetical protein TBR22_A14430 [Luteitalea sp. TBR-22]